MALVTKSVALTHFDRTAVCCPRCGHNYVRQTSVELHDRGFHVRLNMSCEVEGCGSFVLVIREHEGPTFITTEHEQ